MSFVYPLCTLLQRGTLRLFADCKVNGIENVPPVGPLIVVSNHLSYVEPSFLASILPRRTWFLAKHTLFTSAPLANWFLRAWGAFPLRRDAADPRAYRWVLDRLSHDEVVVIFPEGTRSPGAMKRAVPGVERLALKSQAPILPLGITGTEGLQNWHRLFYPNRRIRVNIGQAFSLPAIEGRPNREVLSSLSDMIMGRVAELLPESYRGVYGTGARSKAESVALHEPR